MNMSEKSKQHVEACRFCWMCHHICPVGNATGQERNTAKARAFGISMVNRGAIGLSEIVDNIYECATCGACVHDCTTGWDPVMFTKEVRLQAALEGVLPTYIVQLVENCLTVGNAYGKTEISAELAAAAAAHSAKTDVLLYLGADAVYMAPEQAVKAIRVLEKANVSFTVLEKEPASGAQLDFLIGAAGETKEQMSACAAAFGEFKTVVLYDPADAKALMQTAREYGVEASAQLVTYTAYVAALVAEGKLALERSEKTVVFQDPYQLARDLGETEPAREIIMHCAVLGEMLLNRGETVWAGNILMAQYMPQVIKKVAARRIFNARTIGMDTIVTASVSEYVALKAAAQDVTVLSLEDLILEA